MLSTSINELAEYFNIHWQQYQNYVVQNTLCHREMYAALNKFLHEHMGSDAFSFVEVGCGDCSVIAPVLLDNPIKKYIGIDIAEAVLKNAPTNLAQLNCEKEFISADMLSAIRNLRFPIDIIFSSYAVHHLSYQEKFNFIYECKNKLAADGYFLMIDGILDESQTRDQWLQAFEEFYKKLYPDITEDDLAQYMKHPRTNDFPESISTFEHIAATQEWNGFHIPLRIGLLAFIVFSK